MKKTIKTMLALMAGALTFSACSSEEFTTNENSSNGAMEAKVFTASQEDNSDVTSRSSVSSDGKYVNWTTGDKVTVWDGTAKNEFTAAPVTGTPTSATLTGEVTEGSTSFTAVYPNSVGQNCTFSNDAITGVVIPATQTATAGTFDPAAAVMTATSDGSNFKFKNVCSFLKITADADYTKIVVTTNQNAPIAGTFSVANYGTDPTLTATSGTNVVTLSGTIGSGKTYYIAIAPTSTVMQFAVDCYTSDGVVAKEKVKYYTSAGSFARKNVYNLTNGTNKSTLDWDDFDTNLLSGWFSVSADKLVHFTKGELYWDGNSFHLEENQTDFDEGTTSGDKKIRTANHISHFFWTNLQNYQSGESKYMPYADVYACSDTTATDKCWCGEDNKITVDGTNGLYLLTGGLNSEWRYLLDRNNKSLYKSLVTVTNTNKNRSYNNCLIIAPDGYTEQLKDNYTLKELKEGGLLCEASTGFLTTADLSFLYLNQEGLHWTATPYTTKRAFHLSVQSSGAVNAGWSGNSGARNGGRTIRLVK